MHPKIFDDRSPPRTEGHWADAPDRYRSMFGLTMSDWLTYRRKAVEASDNDAVKAAFSILSDVQEILVHAWGEGAIDGHYQEMARIRINRAKALMLGIEI